jgi:hypothetical protein
MKKVFLLYWLLSALFGVGAVIFVLGLVSPADFEDQATCYLPYSEQTVFSILVRPHRHEDTLWIENLRLTPAGYPVWKEYSRHGVSHCWAVTQAKPYYWVKIEAIKSPFDLKESWEYRIRPHHVQKASLAKGQTGVLGHCGSSCAYANRYWPRVNENQS